MFFSLQICPASAGWSVFQENSDSEHIVLFSRILKCCVSQDSRAKYGKFVRPSRGIVEENAVKTNLISTEAKNASLNSSVEDRSHLGEKSRWMVHWLFTSPINWSSCSHKTSRSNILTLSLWERLGASQEEEKEDQHKRSAPVFHLQNIREIKKHEENANKQDISKNTQEVEQIFNDDSVERLTRWRLKQRKGNLLKFFCLITFARKKER